MKRPHPNGQYCNKIQKKQYVDRNASFEKRRMEAKELSVRSVNYSDGRLLRSGTLYGGTLSLEQTTPARSNLMKLLLGVSGLTPEIRTALDGMAEMWSSGTWQARARLWERLKMFCRWRGIEITAMHAVEFIAALPIKIQGKMTYAGSLAAIFNLSGRETNPLKFYIKSLSAQGATEPVRQMTPLTPSSLRIWWNNLPHAERHTLLLCWKAASRWSETAALTRERFHEVTRTRIVIWWGRATKTSRLNPYRPSYHSSFSFPQRTFSLRVSWIGLHRLCVAILLGLRMGRAGRSYLRLPPRRQHPVYGVFT